MTKPHHPRTIARAPILLRFIHNSPSRRADQPTSKLEVEGATDISHAQFISSASSTSDFNPSQTPHAGTDELAKDKSSSIWQGHLSPTKSHLFKLVLPLPTSNTRSWVGDLTSSGTSSASEPASTSSSSSSSTHNTNSNSSNTPQPTAFLLHPSQPLSHLARLITGSLPVRYRDAEISFLALTGQEDDLDSHLRNAEEEEKARARSGSEPASGQAVQGAGISSVPPPDIEQSQREEGGPFLGEREKDQGRWQEVTWSQSTDLSDFIKQSCLNEKFKIVITPGEASPTTSSSSKSESKSGQNVDSKATNGEQQVDSTGPSEMILEVVIPSFASRTTYLRKRLVSLTKELDAMTKKKKTIDLMAHKSAQRLAVGALSVGAAYWIGVIRMTFFTDAGWDMMEPVTWATGFGALLASCSFLVYHNREVSYSSLLDLSITARQRALYDKHGLDIEKWTEMVAEAKTLRREVARIAADYDIEWKGELESMANGASKGAGLKSVKARELQSKTREDEAKGRSAGTIADLGVKGGKEKQAKDNNINERDDDDHDHDDDLDSAGKTIDIDKTIDEAADLAEQSEEKREKERAAQRKGEVISEPGDTKLKSGSRRGSESEVKEKGRGKEESESVGRRKAEALVEGV